MGNPDLVRIINDKVFIIRGTEYLQVSGAIFKAMGMFDDYMHEIDSFRYDDNHVLYSDADPDWFPESIKSIKVYQI